MRSYLLPYNIVLVQSLRHKASVSVHPPWRQPIGYARISFLYAQCILEMSKIHQAYEMFE